MVEKKRSNTMLDKNYQFLSEYYSRKPYKPQQKSQSFNKPPNKPQQQSFNKSQSLNRSRRATRRVKHGEYVTSYVI